MTSEPPNADHDAVAGPPRHTTTTSTPHAGPPAAETVRPATVSGPATHGDSAAKPKPTPRPMTAQRPATGARPPSQTGAAPPRTTVARPATVANAPAAPAPTASPAVRSKRRKLVLMGAAGALLTIIGLAAWLMLRNAAHAVAESEHEAGEGTADGADGAHDPHAPAARPHEGTDEHSPSAEASGHAQEGVAATARPGSGHDRLDLTELLVLAEAAVRGGRLADARKMAVRIRPLLPKGESELRLRYERILAAAGRPTPQDEAGSGQDDASAEPGPARTARLAAADADFVAGRMQDAREKYLAFLMSAGDLGADEEALIAWAHGRMAIAVAAIWRDKAASVEIPEPKVTFAGKEP